MAGHKPTAPGAQESGQGVHRVQCLHQAETCMSTTLADHSDWHDPDLASACEKAGQWQHALALFSEMEGTRARLYLS